MGNVFKRGDRGESTDEPKPEPAEQGNAGTEGEAPPEPAHELVEFNDVKGSLKTGDLLLLYRKDAEFPNYAVLVDNSANEEYFPLLMIKGPTKPVSKDNVNKRRNLTAVTAVARIFYGDYERVAFCRLSGEQEISAKTALDTVNVIETEKYSEEELTLVDEAESDAVRSVLISVLNLAVLYNKLGVLPEAPSASAVKNTYREWNTTLPVGQPTFIKVPPVKPGPMKKGSPPLYQKIL